MKIIGIICCSILATVSFAQVGGDSAGPLTANPQLLAKQNSSHAHAHAHAKNTSTFDSTFIYNSDTISLPVFDDFSTDKFQTYTDDYLAPESDLHFGIQFIRFRECSWRVILLVPQVLLLELPITNKREVFTNTDLIPVDIQVGDQSVYPTSYATVSAYPPYLFMILLQQLVEQI